MGDPFRDPSRGRVRGAVLVLVVGLVLTGCSGGDEGPEEDPSGTPSASAAPPSEAPAESVPLRASAGEMVGRLKPAQRTRTVRSVAGVVDGWLDAAYLAPEYPLQRPRRELADAFPGFTRGAAQRARADLALMTNAPLAGSIESAVATRREVSVDLLNVGGYGKAATAHVQLHLRTEGGGRSTVRVWGRLMLTRKGDHWRVFAYDVAKDDGSTPRSSVKPPARKQPPRTGKPSKRLPERGGTGKQDTGRQDTGRQNDGKGGSR